MRVYDANNRPIPDDVLLAPHSNGDMHEAVAVANVLKIWINADAPQCCAAMGRVIISGRKTGNSLIIKGKNYPIVMLGTERCKSPTEKNRNIREPYWILNPSASGSCRYVVSTDRPRLAKQLDFVRNCCKNPNYTAIYGMKIK